MKNNQKCVRMSDEVLEYVTRFSGDGFNAQFENMVLYFKQSEPQLKKSLDQLNSDIKAKQAVLRSLGEKIYKFDGMKRCLDVLKDDLSSLQLKTERIING